MKLRTAAELVEQKVGETLTYYAYPSAHWRQVRTNNPLEESSGRSEDEREWSVHSLMAIRRRCWSLRGCGTSPRLSGALPGGGVVAQPGEAGGSGLRSRSGYRQENVRRNVTSSTTHCVLRQQSRARW